MTPFLLFLIALAGQGEDFLPPEKADLRIPFAPLACAGASQPLIVAIEYQDGRNLFRLRQMKDGKEAVTVDRIGGVLGTEVVGGLDLRIRPQTMPKTELVLLLRNDQPLTGTLTLDGGRTTIRCLPSTIPEPVQ